MSVIPEEVIAKAWKSDDEDTMLRTFKIAGVWEKGVFDIPKDGVKLAGSELFSNQAFKVQQNVYGLQFHAEVTIEGFRRWQNSDWPSRLGHQTIEEQTRLMYKHDAAQASWFYDFLNNLFL